MAHRQTKQIFSILAALLLVLVLAFWIIPYIRLMVDANSTQLLAEASHLSSAYQENNPLGQPPSQKAIARDLVYLGYQNIHVTKIASADDSAFVYEMAYNAEDNPQVTTYVDVTKEWNGTLYYHMVDDRNGESTIRVRPWGSTKIF